MSEHYQPRGVLCVLHHTVLVPEAPCPVKGCADRHGFTVEACRPPCPRYRETGQRQ